MVQVFENTVRPGFSQDEVDMMREAYRVVVEMLQLEGFAERRQVAIIVQKLGKLERFPGAPYLADLTIDWYRAGRPID
jgi:hypothetical protein